MPFADVRVLGRFTDALFQYALSQQYLGRISPVEEVKMLHPLPGIFEPENLSMQAAGYAPSLRMPAVLLTRLRLAGCLVTNEVEFAEEALLAKLACPLALHPSVVRRCDPEALPER